jgi:hypothetical protein
MVQQDGMKFLRDRHIIRRRQGLAQSHRKLNRATPRAGLRHHKLAAQNRQAHGLALPSDRSAAARPVHGGIGIGPQRRQIDVQPGMRCSR